VSSLTMPTHITNMKIINTINEMQKLSDELRKSKRIGFVPTMGYLHEGHMSLIRKARELGDITIASIFVNPIQFGPQEDLAKYPRDFKRDAELLKKEKTDIIFHPFTEEMYSHDFSTYVEVKRLEDFLCGKTRAGHFVGVATVVTKLFNIVKPHFAVFGQKDFQQLVIIEKMVRDLNMDIEIIGHPTVREPDGLAMSSRNTYLSKSERGKALLINKSLKKAEQLFWEGERKTATLKKEVEGVLRQQEGITIEYIEICDSRTFEELDTIKNRAVLAIACRIGKTRLIDNTILTEA
jgi:pantoate--beta-alanine ligase